MKLALLTASALLGALVLQVPAQEKGDGKAVEFRGDLRSVEMIDAKTGWALGVSGNHASVLQTHDGGKSWIDISPPLFRSEKMELASDADDQIFFHLQDADHGWASIDVGGKEPDGPDEQQLLFSTKDGGRSWKRSAFQTSIGQVASLQFVDAKHGFLRVEAGPTLGHAHKAVYRTTDGGKTWRMISEDLPGMGFGDGMVFRNSIDGWITGSPRGDETEFFFRTRDGGRTWEPEPLKPPPGFTLYYAEVKTPQFFGDQKIDGVFSAWFIQHDPERKAFLVYNTHDGGKHWSQVNDGPTGLPESSGSPSFIDMQHGWAADDEKLFVTTDGGAKWQPLETNLRVGDGEMFMQFDFVSATDGFVVKEISDHHELLQTTDGGRTWVHRYGPQSGPAAP